MHITVISIFPELIRSFCAESLLGRAQSSGALTIKAIDLRDFAAPPHYKVDDIPFGGGAGMVMLAEPLIKAIRAAKTDLPSALCIYLSPAGERFTQQIASELSQRDLIIVCGRYEGIDQRVIDAEIDAELSLGDFVLMGGEAAALCVIEATTRLLPNVLGNSESATEESFDKSGLLEAPCFSRPASLPEGDVPQVLLSGNHKVIAEWRTKERMARTKARRPDLLARMK
jgi:tRNA (guanine37-N1)-methyltransferase